MTRGSILLVCLFCAGLFVSGVLLWESFLGLFVLGFGGGRGNGEGKRKKEWANYRGKGDSKKEK